MKPQTAQPQAVHALKVTNPELIPTARYFDPDFFELEKKHMWPRVWQMACRLEEIPAVGDYTVYTMLDHSVLLLHTPGGVRAFRNACRHREFGWHMDQAAVAPRE